MKKSFLAVAGLALVLTLAGCAAQGGSEQGGKSSEQGSSPASSETSDTGSSSTPVDVVIPEEEGKLTLYLTAHFDGVELASYASINIAGSATSWNSGETSKTQAQRLGETDIYYVQVDAPAAGDIGYKIILGYNSTSGLSDDQLGVNWGNEGTGYPDGEFGPGSTDKHYDFAGTELKVNLGDYTWKTMLPEPVLEYHDATLYVDFYEDIPAGHHVYLMGALNNWASPIEMTKVEAEGVFRYQTAKIEHLLEKSYEFKVLVHPQASDAEGFNVWSDDRFEVVPGANSVVAINALFDIGPRNIFGGTKKYHAANQLTSVVAAAADTAVAFTAKVFAVYGSNAYQGIFVGDRENAIMVYKTPDATNPMPKVGDTVAVEGKISIYKDQREVIPDGSKTLIAVVEDHNQVVNYTEVNADFVSGLASATKVDVMNKALHYKGTVASTESEGAEDTEFTLQLAIADGVTFPLYVKSAKDAAATVAALAALEAGAEIEVWGALGAYNTTYQFVCVQIA